MDSTHKQRTRLLDALRHGPITVDQARMSLGISNPGARVFELRHSLGANIVTLSTHQPQEDGSRRRVAAYVLMESQKEASHA